MSDKGSGRSFRLHLLLLAVASVLVLVATRGAHLDAYQGSDDSLTPSMRAFLADQEPALKLAPLGASPCTNGFAGSYPCHNVDLLAFVPLASFGASSGNDSWGWSDPLTGKEYALMGVNDGTVFVDISDPENPLYLGKLPTHTTSSSWRDVKVYDHYAFIVSEASGHGMQVFDLTELRTVANPPTTFAETAHYDGFGNAHNIVINEESGYAYAVGGNCDGGLHMIDIRKAIAPTGAGCFSSDGPTHDAQCVNYKGPDPDHQGEEICFNSNGDTLTIVDVSEKATPTQISRTGYAGSGYAHQGWLTPDHRYFLLDDELDEQVFEHNTRTYVWDVSDLDNPILSGDHTGSVAAIDHNQYVHSGYLFQANYRAGLRVLDLANVAVPSLQEVAYFDTYPANDDANFNSAWNVYPFFDSGVAMISTIGEGLFIVRPNLVPHYNASLSGNTNRSGAPTTTVTHSYTMVNLGADDSYAVSVGGASWPTTLATPGTITVTAEASATITVNVTIPGDAIPGESDAFDLSIQSTGDPALLLNATGTTGVAGAAAITTSGDMIASGASGETITHTLTITNSGLLADSFTASVEGATWPTTLVPGQVALSPGDSGQLAIVVTIGNGGPDVALITIRSGLEPEVTATVTATTVTYWTMLPALHGGP